jgi:hypothetical protein
MVGNILVTIDSNSNSTDGTTGTISKISNQFAFLVSITSVACGGWVSH